MSANPPFGDEHLELQYPCPWSYRVIGRDLLSLQAAVATVIGARDYTVSAGHESSGGRYHSVNVELIVESEAQRQSIFHDLVRHADIAYVL